MDGDLITVDILAGILGKIASADTGPETIGSTVTKGGDGAAPDGDGAAFAAAMVILSSADAGAISAALGRNGTAVDGDGFSAAAFASTDAGAVGAARGVDLAAPDGDGAARPVFATADTRSIFAAFGYDVAAVDDDGSGMVGVPVSVLAAYACSGSSVAVVSCKLAHIAIVRLAMNVQRGSLGREEAFVDGDLGAVAEDDVPVTAPAGQSVRRRAGSFDHEPLGIGEVTTGGVRGRTEVGDARIYIHQAPRVFHFFVRAVPRSFIIDIEHFPFALSCKAHPVDCAAGEEVNGIARIVGFVSAGENAQLLHIDADAFPTAGEGSGSDHLVFLQVDIIARVAFDADVVHHGQCAVVPDAGSVGMAGVVGDVDGATQVDSAIVDDAAAPVLGGAVVVDGAGAAQVKRGARFDIDAAGVLRRVFGDGHIGERGGAGLEMDGAAVAFIVIIAALCKGFVAGERAVLDGKVAAAPDGAAACGGDVAGEGAAADGGRAVVDQAASAFRVPAAGDGAARELEVGRIGHDDDAALRGGAAEIAAQGIAGQVDGYTSVAADGERLARPGDVVGEDDVVAVDVVIGLIQFRVVMHEGGVGHLDRDGVELSFFKRGDGFGVTVTRSKQGNRPERDWLPVDGGNGDENLVVRGALVGGRDGDGGITGRQGKGLGLDAGSGSRRLPKGELHDGLLADEGGVGDGDGAGAFVYPGHEHLGRGVVAVGGDVIQRSALAVVIGAAEPEVKLVA